MSKREYFLKELEGIDEVPTLPQVAFQLIALISNEQTNMREISNLIEEDPPLVAKILRMVNSGFYNLRNEVNHIRQAVVLIGLQELRNLVFAMSVYSTFYNIKMNDHFSFTTFWKHSAATGKVATVLCNYLGISNSHNAFIGGLLHDFGRLVLQLYFQDDYEAVFKYSIENNVNLYRAEQETIGFKHDEAGFWLAKKWNMPENLSKIIRDHHCIRIEEVEKNLLLALIHVADRITNIWGVGIEPNPDFDSIEDNPVWDKLCSLYPKLKEFPIDEMTRVFDMQLEEAEIFVEQISSYHATLEDVKK